MAATLYYGRRPTAAPLEPLAELDAIVLDRNVMSDGNTEIPAGAKGTIVGVWAEGKAYEVEFAEFGLATVEAAFLRRA